MSPPSLHRFYVDPARIAAGRARLTRAQAHQIARVLRLRRGDLVAVFDGTGAEYEAELLEFGEAGATALLKAPRRAQPEPALRLVLLQGLPKGDKMDLVVQKATELGVHRIVPLLCERSVARRGGRLARWLQIAQESAEQSGRAVVPRIEAPLPFAAYFSAGGGSEMRGLALWEEEQATTMRAALAGLSGLNCLHLLVGPEGGLTRGEVALATRRGLLSVTLGPRTLRSETAGLVAMAIIQYERGDLGAPAGA